MTRIAGLPIVYQLCGDKTGTDNIESDHHLAALGGFADWAAEAGPVMESQGYKRLFLHNPGGQFTMHNPDDPHLMLIDQWRLAKMHNFSYANDAHLRAMYRQLTRENGIREIIIYLGTPGFLTDPYYDGMEAVKPFMNLGTRIAFSFDVLGLETYDWPSATHESRALLFVKALRAKGFAVYLEPRPAASETHWIGQVDGTAAGASVDVARPAQLAVARDFGEVLRLTDDEASDGDTTGWENWVTPIIRLWRTRHASTVMGTAP
jgi:hypothetical protein